MNLLVEIPLTNFRSVERLIQSGLLVCQDGTAKENLRTPERCPEDLEQVALNWMTALDALERTLRCSCWPTERTSLKNRKDRLGDRAKHNGQSKSARSGER